MMNPQFQATIKASGGDPALAVHRDKAAQYQTTGGKLYSLLPKSEAEAQALAPFVLNDPELRQLLAAYLDLNTLMIRDEYRSPEGAVAADNTDLSCFGRGCREEWDVNRLGQGGLPCTLFCPHGPSHIPSNQNPRGFVGQGPMVHPDGEPVGNAMTQIQGIVNVDYSQGFTQPPPVQDPTGQGYQIITDACPALMTFFRLFQIPPGPSFAINSAILRLAPEVLGRAVRAHREHEAQKAASQAPLPGGAPLPPPGGVQAPPAAPPVTAPAAPPVTAPGVPPAPAMTQAPVQAPGAMMATPAPGVPGQSAVPPSPTQQKAPPAPWANPSCVACSTGAHPGFATSGAPCPHCNSWAIENGRPTTRDFEIGQFTWKERPPAATAAQTPPGAPVGPPVTEAPPAAEGSTTPPPPGSGPPSTALPTSESTGEQWRDWLIKGQFIPVKQVTGAFERGMSNGGVAEATKRVKRLATSRKIADADTEAAIYRNWLDWYVAANAITEDAPLNPRKSAGWKELLEKCGNDAALAHNEALRLSQESPAQAPAAASPVEGDPEDPFAGEPGFQAASAATQEADDVGVPDDVALETLEVLRRIERGITTLVNQGRASQQSHRLPPDVV